MAIDTRNKRFSIMGLATPTVRPLPEPDGTIAQADRQHFALMYSGILLGAAVVTATSYLEYTAPARNLEYTAPARNLDYTTPER